MERQTARSPDLVVDHAKDQLAARCDVEDGGLPAEEIELRTFGNGQYYGRFMLRPKPASRPSLQARLVAVTLAGQADRVFSSR